MIKNFVKHGNSWAIVIDRPILDLLKINPESEIELTTDGQSIRIAPAAPTSEKAKVRAASEKINAKHSKAFRKLAE
jgi:antitoxin MazE